MLSVVSLTAWCPSESFSRVAQLRALFPHKQRNGKVYRFLPHRLRLRPLPLFPTVPCVQNDHGVVFGPARTQIPHDRTQNRAHKMSEHRENTTGIYAILKDKYRFVSITHRFLRIEAAEIPYSKAARRMNSFSFMKLLKEQRAAPDR